jgi:hypothetical protein
MVAADGIEVGEAGKTVSVTEAARHCGVTPQTINNWAKRGLDEKAVVGTTAAGRKMYDLDKLKTWARQNTGWVHGGKREGSGRKPGLWAAANAHQRPEPPSPPPPKKTEAREPRVVLDEQAEDMLDFGEVRDLDDLMRLAEQNRLPVARVNAIRSLWDAKAKEREHKIKMGQLVDAEQWTRELTVFLASMRREMESMAGRMTSAICQQLAVSEPEAVHKVREHVQAEVDRFIKNVHGFETRVV